MKMSATPSRIRGVQVGEATINLIRSDHPVLKVKFALVRDDELACGHFEKSAIWSEKALEALHSFIAVLEDEALGLVFDAGQEASEVTSDDTSQF
jgi:hypothetical protein